MNLISFHNLIYNYYFLILYVIEIEVRFLHKKNVFMHLSANSQSFVCNNFFKEFVLRPQLDNIICLRKKLDRFSSRQRTLKFLNVQFRLCSITFHPPCFSLAVPLKSLKVAIETVRLKILMSSVG